MAVEIAPEGVLAAALPAKNEPAVYAFAPLRAGALMPGIGEPNLRASEAVTDAVRTALGDVSPRTRAVTLVVPDTAVRVFVLDFDSLPGECRRSCSGSALQAAQDGSLRRGARRGKLPDSVARTRPNAEC